MFLFLGWIDAIDAIADMDFWGCGLGGMEENKKSAPPKKKLRLPLKMAHRVYQRWHVPTYDSCHDRPEALRSATAISKLRFRLRLRLQFVHNMPSLMAVRKLIGTKVGLFRMIC